MLPESQTWSDQNERRYELTREVALRVLAGVSQHLPVVTFGDAPPTTLVATMYFDSPELSYLQMAQADNGVSVKVRAREYLAVTDDENRQVISEAPHCYLERKERTGRVRQKYRLRIKKSDLADISEGSLDISESILRRELHLRELVPTLISLYERRVWGNEDLRITFDERIRYYRPSERPYQGYLSMKPAVLGTPLAVRSKRILEVKHSVHTPVPSWLQLLLADTPESTRFSKYLDGMAALNNARRRRPLTRPIFIG